MKSAISVMQKRGRPATGKTPTIALRATEEWRASVEAWAAKQHDKPQLSEAIRRLVDQALAIDVPMGRTSSKNAARAAELAVKAIDCSSDAGATAEERNIRKRRIIDGPSMARSSRKDRN